MENLRIFISSVQKEFASERSVLRNYLKDDPLLRRERSVQVPVEYEIPQEVVREAIVNAVAHRDYTSNGSVQVMLFSDRLEVWNPGTLPAPLTLAKLRHPHGSVPGNPLLAEPLYLTKYIERMGTGTGDMIERCRKAGLKEPEFTLSDGFVTTIRRKPGRAFEAVGGQSESVTDQVGTKLGPSQSVGYVFAGKKNRRPDESFFKNKSYQVQGPSVKSSY
jgi:ATP-dependent DNA helicase RecG